MDADRLSILIMRATVALLTVWLLARLIRDILISA